MSSELTPLSTAPVATEKSKFFTVAVNGTAIYVLAYYLVVALHQLAKYSLSKYYLLRGMWDPSSIVYTMGDNEWWRTAIIAVNGVGPLVGLVLAYIAFLWYWKRTRAKRGLFKLLLIWLAFHGCNAFFGALLADTFTQSGFWYVPSWLFELGNIVNVLMAFIAGLAQIALGYFAAVPFLQAHDSKTLMRYQNRQQMVFYTLVLPWLAGTILIILAKTPYITIQEILRLLMMGLLITPTGLGCLNELFESTVRRPRPTQFGWGYIVLALLLALGWRLALSPPVLFG